MENRIVLNTVGRKIRMKWFSIIGEAVLGGQIVNFECVQCAYLWKKYRIRTV